MSTFNQTNTNWWTWYQAENMNILNNNLEKDIFECLELLKKSNIKDKENIIKQVEAYRDTKDQKKVIPLIEKFNLPLNIWASGLSIIQSIIGFLSQW